MRAVFAHSFPLLILSVIDLMIVKHGSLGIRKTVYVMSRVDPKRWLDFCTFYVPLSTADQWDLGELILGRSRTLLWPHVNLDHSKYQR